MAKSTIKRKRVYSFRLDEHLVDGLRQVYERDGILPSEQLRRVVEAWLEKKGIDLADAPKRMTPATKKRRT
jgi:hypothetical protein